MATTRSTLRIALVSPPYGGASERSMRPIGLMAIAAYLRAELDGVVHVDLIDFSDCDTEAYGLIERYALPAYDVVGMCAYSTNFPVVLQWARRVKAANPGVVTVVGGPHPTALPEHVAGVHRDAFDFVVRGEGEKPLTHIVRELLAGRPLNQIRAAGIYRQTPLGISAAGTDPIADLDAVPPPFYPVLSPYEQSCTYSDLKTGSSKPAIPMTSSRGCPFRCSFCSIQAQSSSWRSVSAARIGDWIKHARAEAKVTPEHVYFMDADFSINKKRVAEIGHLFADAYPDMTWSFSARVDDLARLGDDTLAALVRQGLAFVEVGIESGSQGMLDRMNKKIKVEQNDKAIALLRRHNLYMGMDFILFMPDETPAHLQETLDWLRKLRLADYMPQDHYYSYFLPYPGTPLRGYYEELFGTKFSNDELPRPDDWFIDDHTKRIFKFFVRDFMPVRAKLPRLVDKLERTSIRTDVDTQTAQRARLEAFSMRHLPFRVLSTLVASPQATTLYDAAPWLGNFDRYAAQMEELCAA